MEPGRASWQAGRLGGDAAAIGGQAAVAHNPYRSAGLPGKIEQNSVISFVQGNLAAGIPSVDSSRTGIGSHGVAGLELPSLEAIKLLLARYPGLGSALQHLDWDDHGRISKPTLLRIISALDGDQLLCQDGTTAAPAQAPTAPAHTAQLQQQQGTACCADGAACAGIPAGSAGLPAVPAAAQEAASSPAQAPTASPAVPAAAAAASPSPRPALDAFAAAWGRNRAALPALSTESVSGGATSASTPTSACGGSPAAGAGTISSAGSSRRTSLRPTLSIDISSLRVSDSSDSGGDGDSSSGAEPPAPAPAMHAAGSHAGAAAAASTVARTSAESQHAAVFLHTPAPAGQVQDSSSGGSHAEPAAVVSESGGKKKHCSTPGIALRAPMQFFENPLEDGPDADAEDDSYSADEGAAEAQDACAHAAHSACASSSAQHSHVAAGRQATQQQQARSSGKAGRKAQTPATGLGKPVSIFSGDGSPRGHAAHDAAEAAGAAAHGLHAGEAGEAEQGEQGEGHSWHHKLSKRPPTPGVSLSQPVSIFSGGGSSLNAGLAYEGQHTVAAPVSSQHSPFATNGRPHDGNAVSFAQHPAFYSKARPSGSQQQRQDRPHSAPGARSQAACEAKAGRHHKPSKRAPTPGNALGKPMSIFSGSGILAERSGRSGSESDVSESGEDSTADASGQHLVTFADAHGFDIELEAGASSKPYASNAPRAAASAPGSQHKQLPALDRQQEDASADGRWHHKLSQRAPTPGASLAQPVSICSGSGRGQSASAEAEDDSAHVKFADPSRQHVSRSSGSRSTSAAAAVASRQQADTNAAADGTVAEQHHWDHKLSKRPPTPGVSLGKPVSIFSASGASSQGVAAGRRGSADSAASEGTCSEEEVGHVHFAAPRANSSSAAGSRIPLAPADRNSSSDGDDAAPPPTSHSGKSKAAARRAGAVPQQQHEQQQWHHKLSKRPPTPGVSLGQPVSIFSSSGSSGVAAAAGAVSAAPAAEDVDSAGVHIHFADQPVVHSSSNAQHSASASGRRVSWGNEAEVVAPQHEQPAAHHPKLQQQKLAAHIAAAGSTSGSRSEGRQAGSERRRITWGDDAASSSAPGGSSSAAGQHQERRVTWGEEDVPAGTASCTGADSASSAGAQTGSRRVTWGDDDEAPAPADGRGPGPGNNSSTGQQQHGKGKPGARPGTPGWALGQHPESIFLQHANEDASQVAAAVAAPLPAVAAAAAAGAAGYVAARARSAGPSLIARLNPDLAAEAAQQKWLQHMADRPPTPGAPLQPQHNIFAEVGASRSPRSAAADSCKLSRIPSAPLAAATSSSTDDSSSSMAPGGAGTAKQALSKLSPELAAEAQQQRWQQHMANRPPTPGAGLLDHPNIFAEHAAGVALAAVDSSKGQVSNSSRSYAAAAACTDNSCSSPAASSPARPSASKQALLRLSPELAAEAAQQKWQQHMANRPPTPGASLGHHSIFAGQDDDAGSAATTHGTPTATASSNKMMAAVYGSSDSSTPGGPAPGRASAQQALLRLSPELAAEAQEQKWQQHMTNRPPTPGDSLRQHNIFADDDPTPDPTAQNAPAAARASVQAVRAASSSNMSRIPSGPVAASAAASAQQALLKLRPELAAEAQEQKWQQPMANRPPTPGASLLHRPNIFAEADAEDTPPAAAAAGGGGGGGASRSSSMTQGTPGLHSALLLHNPDLVIEKQQQWEQKLSRRPPTPAATLGKNHNMFADDEQDQAQPPMLRLPSGSTSSSAGGVGGAVGSASVVALPASAAVNRSRSPDQARTSSSSSGEGSSPGRGDSPTEDSPASEGSNSSSGGSSRRSSRSGSSNPGRQRGSSPLRNTTTAAEVAEQQDRATHSPLRHSSSMCDPDPARMSPLGRRTSATGASPSSSTPSTPTVTKPAPAAAPAAVPVSTPAVTAVAIAVAQEPVVGGQAQDAKAARQSQLGGVQSEPHSPSRLARSASPSVLARESGRTSVVQRSSSPLSRSSSSTGQGAEPVRHGSPLSRCSRGGVTTEF